MTDTDLRHAIAGIDLGTTYSCVAYIDEYEMRTGSTPSPTVAVNKESESTTPSVVNFPKDEPGHYVVGSTAKEYAVLEPERTAQFVKSLIGRERVACSIDGKDWSPQEISSLVLKKITADACETSNIQLDGVVITVPAYFGSDRVEATKQAGELAGLKVLGTVQEPVAAAVFYGAFQSERDTDVLVYDLGGGTFDVSVLSIKKNPTSKKTEIEVVCNDGDHDLGGRLWDDALMEYLEERYRAEVGGDESPSLEDLQSLRTKAEQAKKILTEKPSHKVVFALGGPTKRVEVTREIFDDLTQDLLQQTLDLTKKALGNAASKGVNAEKILLVGGSTLMPQVRTALEREFGLPISLTDPHQAVAKGAALYAVSAYGQKASDGEGRCWLPEPDCGVGVKLVTSKSYGVAVLCRGADNDERKKICNIIFKNTPPASGRKPEDGARCVHA